MPRTKKSEEPQVEGTAIAAPTNKAVANKDQANGSKEAGGTVGKDQAKAPASGAPTAAPTNVRKPLGAKEVIPFAWKVIGLSGDMVLTLFKSIEREDSEVHLNRLDRDGAYANLRLVEADFKIVQPKSVKAAFAASEKKAKSSASAKKTKKKKTKTTTESIKLAKRKVTPSTAKASAAKASAAKKTKKVARGSTAAKKKVKKTVKKAVASPSKAKKSTKKALKKKTKTKSSKKKAKAKKK